MRFTIEQNELSRALSAVVGAAESKGALPILATVRIEASVTNRVATATFVCSDLTTTVRAKAVCVVESVGAVCVDAKQLSAIAKALPKQSVEVSVDETTGVTIRAGKRRFTLPMLAASDYPDVPRAKSDGGAEIDAEPLRLLLERTAPSMSTDDTRPHLACTLIEANGAAGVRGVSTDGHRLTVADVAGSFGSLRVQAPVKACAEIRKLADRGNPVTLSVNTGGTMFAVSGDLEIAAKLIDASFPAYEQVIPKTEPTTVVTVKRAALLDAVRAVSLVSGDRTSGIRLRFGKDSLTIDSENPDVGSGLDEVPIDNSGAPLVIGVNSRYLADALNAADDGDVTIEATGELDPMVVRASGVLCVLMPMRI